MRNYFPLKLLMILLFTFSAIFTSAQNKSLSGTVSRRGKFEYDVYYGGQKIQKELPAMMFFISETY